MLSSALKFGITKHLEPHEYQFRSNSDLGVPALKWQNGLDAENVRSMIDVVTKLRSESGARPGLLERVFRASAQMVADGAPLNSIGYSTRERDDALRETSLQEHSRRRGQKSASIVNTDCV